MFIIISTPYMHHVCIYPYTIKTSSRHCPFSDCDLVPAPKGLESRRLLFKTITCHHPLCFGCGCTFLFLTVSCFPISEKARKRLDPWLEDEGCYRSAFVEFFQLDNILENIKIAKVWNTPITLSCFQKRRDTFSLPPPPSPPQHLEYICRVFHNNC